MRAWPLAAALTLMAIPALAHATPASGADGSIMLAQDQNGQSLDARVGRDVTVELERNASAATGWVVASKPDFLGDPRQAEMAPGLPGPRLGAPSWQLFIFPVSEAGAGALTLEKHDRTGATIETFTVTITAQ